MSPKARDLALVHAISFMDLFAVGLTFPLLGNHLRDLGASHFLVGLISSAYSGLQVVSGPIVGSWSDVRDRKSVLMVTLAVSSVAYLMLGTTTSLVFITGIRFMLGVTKHTQSLCKAIITDILPVGERAGAFAQSAAYGQLGFIVGPILGGHLSELSNGFSYVCAVTGLLFLINMGLASVIDYGTRGRSGGFVGRFGDEFRKSIGDIWDINWGAFWDIFLLRFIFGFSVTMYFSQQAAYLRDHFALSQKEIGYTISYYSAAGTLSAFLLSYINNAFYKDDVTCLRRITHFFGLMGVSAVVLALAPNIQVFLLVLMPFSLSSNVLRIVSMELLLKRAAEDHRGSLSGTSNSIMSIARFVTPVTSGIITDRVGSESAMLCAGLPPLIGTLMALRLQKKTHTL